MAASLQPGRATLKSTYCCRGAGELGVLPWLEGGGGCYGWACLHRFSLPGSCWWLRLHNQVEDPAEPSVLLESANSPMKQCRWVYGRQVYMSDISLNRSEMMFVTQDGEAFRGKWMDENRNLEKRETVSNLQSSPDDVWFYDTKNVYERIRLEKLTFVHRAVSFLQILMEVTLLCCSLTLKQGTTTSTLRTDEHSSEPIQLESQNPWVSASSLSPAAATPITFAEIVEEELQQEAALIRSREKPLALIQIEEHAIQDLLIHYQALGNPDEYVVVERCPQGPIAAPMWNKH